MYELTLERHLHVRHSQRLYDGAFEPMHSHRWQVSAQVSAPVLDAIGAVMDFNVLARFLDEVIAELEAEPLNQLPAFRERNSSGEAVAAYIGERLQTRLPPGVRLDGVSLYRDEAIRARFAYRSAR